MLNKLRLYTLYPMALNWLMFGKCEAEFPVTRDWTIGIQNLRRQGSLYVNRGAETDASTDHLDRL